MKRVFYRSLCAVLCVSMLSAAIPVRVIAEEEQRQENTLEQVETGAADNSGGSFTSDIDTSEIGNESIKDESDFANPISRIQFRIRRNLRFPWLPIYRLIRNKPQRPQ